MFKLENNFASVEVSEQAAEVVSFFNKENNKEYMWKGDPKYWSGRNPILFPIVGNTYNKKYTLYGKEYAFKTNHGFTRNAKFKCVKSDGNEIIMRLEDDEDTYSQYPFHFTLDAIYKLDGKVLTITYVITNNDEKDMPFGFGLHPAFNCPLNENETIKDYYIKFTNNEDNKNLIGDFELKGDRIDLSYEIFEGNETIVFENINSLYVSLTNGKNGVKVSAMGYRWFAIWTKNNFPFVCLEPWHSHTDFEEVKVDFDKREGTIILKPNNSYTTSYTIEIF